jgi:type I restriction enzyme M protein
MLQNNATLKSLIDKLWNNFWSGGIANPLTAIEQITYLLFMKRLDDIELKRERDGEFTGEKYDSRFSGTFTIPGTKEKVKKQTLRWSHFKHLPAEEMLVHVQTKVFPYLKDMNGKSSPFTKHMANAVFIIPKASLLVEAIKIIEDIFKEIESDATEGGHSFQDIQGDVYEMLLSEIASAGKMGQFRTPRHIIKLLAELVQPQLGQNICDPACGTGGFLLGAYQYILTDLVRKKDKSRLKKDEDGFEKATMSAVLTEKVKNNLQNKFHGYDIDQTMVRLGLMNLMMHGIDEPQIDYRDTLGKNFNEDSTYEIIMANPPFTGNLDKADLFDHRRTTTTKTELLFLERIFNMLRKGGTAGVIIPQGVLFGNSNAFVEVRKMLIEESELRAVVTMPSGVFKPYAGVATAILLFTKAGETKNVWFYDMKADGYSLDDKRNKIAESDLQDIVKQFRLKDKAEKNDRTGNYFRVDKQEIVDNEYDLSFGKYKVDVYTPIKYDAPKTILAELRKIEDRIDAGLTELDQIL